jgi:ferric-dicitrate binding protein FerR (iron transport regulator)
MSQDGSRKRSLEKTLMALGHDWRESVEHESESAVAQTVEAILNPAPARVVPVGHWLVRGALVAAALAAVAVGGWMAWARTAPVGAIQYRSHGEGDLLAHVALKRHQAIVTPESGATLASLDNGRIRLLLGGESNLSIDADDRVALNGGRAWFEVAPNSGPFEVRTPGATVFVTGTVFGVEWDGSTAIVSVSSGSVDVSAEGRGRVSVKGGESVTADASGALRPSETTGSAGVPPWVTETLGDYELQRALRFFPSARPGQGQGAAGSR